MAGNPGRMDPVPELPEVEALVRFMDEHTRGLEILSCDLSSIAALKTFDPPLDSIVGSHILGWSRRGKYLCCNTDHGWLIVHLARAGWIRWREPTLPAKPPSPTRNRGRGPIALSVGLEEGFGFDVTEMGSQKRLAIWVVRDPSEVPGIETLGIDPLDPEFTVERLQEILSAEPGTVKTVISRQSAIAGIGNAYSDEALHAAAPVSIQSVGTSRSRRRRTPPRRDSERRERSRRASGRFGSVGAQRGQKARDPRPRPDRRGVPRLWRHSSRGFLRNALASILPDLSDGREASGRPPDVEVAAVILRTWDESTTRSGQIGLPAPIDELSAPGNGTSLSLAVVTMV